MAVLIHHRSHPTAASLSSHNGPCRHLITPPKSQVICHPSRSNAPPFLCYGKSGLFSYPSTSFSKKPTSETVFIQNPHESPRPLSEYDRSYFLRLSVQYSDVQLSKAVHASVLKIEENTRMFNPLITSYFELGHVDCAQKVFNSLSSPDIVSYTAMISGMARCSRESEAVGIFFEMISSGIQPNEYTFVALVTACVRLLNLEFGSQVHSFLVKLGYMGSTYVVNSLLSLYGKCGCLEFMIKLFDEMIHKDVASWNTVIYCFVKEGLYDKAFELFYNMLRLSGCKGDYYTFSSLLIASARCFAIREGRQIHSYAYRIGYETNLSVNNALLEFYSNCGCVKDVETLFERMQVKDIFTYTEMVNAYMRYGLVDLAVEVFRGMPEKNCISYSSLLSGLCQNGMGFKAFALFCRMVKEGLELTDFTLTSILNACGLMMDTRTSEQIHGFVLKCGFGSNQCIETALLDMCSRCGRMADAEKIFHQFIQDQSSSFMLTSMICAYSRNGEPDKAMSLMCWWHNEGHCVLDEVALASILGICGELAFLKLGEQCHCKATKCGLLIDIGLGNALITMYSKCGYMEQATGVFYGMSEHDVVSWNSLLSCHILNRQGEKALTVWENMKKSRIAPDTVTFSLIISAYRHTKTNLVDSCWDLFLSMKSNYHVEPDSDHYACLISVLGYWGLLKEAEEVINNMPFEPKASVWRALLDSCRMHANASIGKRAAKKILSIEPQDPSTYILKSNLYSASGRWQCAELIREEMRYRGFRKFPGRSWIIHQNKIHSFFARDRSHSESDDIYSALDILCSECLKAGYIPDTSFVLHEVEEHQKMNFLLYHCAKLAVVYGILAIRTTEPVRVVKNINLCGDCHTFFKYVSVVIRREIHVRDASGFHRFFMGECSCKEYL
ncbi:pentatricopeptide repeat-containing protein [Dorcoceras hygrometricum]|uniref:Pentatricopeptide repeat-containing protein n=1 Tax=Dorcoceras hygrometricum TaxID=472368 RepID=A0A2Z7B991_9LAMI|nr:pentatricopeptide repeat-containing protein [Dorcoceras hygrometricum]